MHIYTHMCVCLHASPLKIHLWKPKSSRKYMEHIKLADRSPPTWTHSSTPRYHKYFTSTYDLELLSWCDTCCFCHWNVNDTGKLRSKPRLSWCSSFPIFSTKVWLLNIVLTSLLLHRVCCIFGTSKATGCFLLNWVSFFFGRVIPTN